MKFLFAFLLIAIIGIVAAQEKPSKLDRMDQGPEKINLPELIKEAYAEHFNDFLKVFGKGKKDDSYNWGPKN